MLRSSLQFQSIYRQLAPQNNGFHFMIPQYPLATKLFPAFLRVLLAFAVKIVNCVQTLVLNTPLLKEIYRHECRSSILTLWNSINCSKWKLLIVFLRKKWNNSSSEGSKIKDLVINLSNEAWKFRLAFISSVLNYLNNLNFEL